MLCQRFKCSVLVGNRQERLASPTTIARQCEVARRSLMEGRDHVIELMYLCQGQDYQCSFRRIGCSELRSGWSDRMTLLKDVIERELANGVKPPIEVIILVGSWNCAKHDQDLIGRCTACQSGVCVECIKAEGG